MITYMQHAVSSSTLHLFPSVSPSLIPSTLLLNSYAICLNSTGAARSQHGRDVGDPGESRKDPGIGQDVEREVQRVLCARWQVVIAILYGEQELGRT